MASPGAAPARPPVAEWPGRRRAWRDAVEASKPNRPPTSARRAAPEKSPEAAEASDAERRAARDARQAEDWELVEEVRDEAAGAVSRGASRRRTTSDPAPLHLAEEVREQLAKAVGNARSERVERRLGEAAEHFENERYGDAARILKRAVGRAPTVAAVRELYGLNLYLQEKWTQAARELEAFRLLSNSTEQHPVLADCYRALRQWPQVEELWEELARRVQPGCRAGHRGTHRDGRLAGRPGPGRRRHAPSTDGLVLPQAAEGAPSAPGLRARRPLRSGPARYRAARDLFQRIRAVDADFADVRDRLRNLR